MSNVLKPTGNDGDFVHKGQTMAKDEGFSCVSRKWWEQTKSIDDGINEMEERKRQRHDFLLPVKAVKFGLSGNDVVLEIEGNDYQFTDHAAKQAAKWCGQLSTQFVKDMRKKEIYKPNGDLLYKRDEQDAQVLLMAFKNGKRRIDPEKKFRFRTYSDGTIRAWLSELYAPIDNVWYLEQIKDLLGDNARLSHWRGNADTIYGNLLIPDTVRQFDDSDYGGMLSVGNCEIGIRKFSQFPSVFRAICMNGCIWDQSKGNVIEQVHKGKIDLNSLRERICANIHKQIPLMEDAVTKFLEKRSFKVEKGDSFKAVLAEVAKKAKLTLGNKGQIKVVVKEFLDHESDNKNLFGIINAITRAGQNERYDDATWLQFDAAAGDLMNLNRNGWDHLRNRARNLSVKEVDEAYGVMA